MIQELQEELGEVRAKGLFRKLRTLSRIQGTHASWEGKEIVLFCGNDYLGLSQDERVKEAAREAIARYGVGAGAARLISGTSDLHTQLERELARFKTTERALIFGSGYLANVGALTALAGEEDLIVMDKLCHASLIDGAKLSGARIRTFPHKNYRRSEEILATAQGYRRKLLVSDSLFSMDGDWAELEELVRLKDRHGAILVVDDAHAIGIFGSRGQGLVDERYRGRVDVTAGTLSKAFGVFGGFLAGSEEIVESLINFSRPFLFATSPPPALMAACLTSLRLIEEEPFLRERLWKNVDAVREFLRGKGRPSGYRSPILPIPVGDEKEAVRISEELLEKGVLVPAIRYPTVPRGKARLRLTVSAAHTDEDLEKLFGAFP